LNGFERFFKRGNLQLEQHKIWATTTEKKTGLQSGSVRFYGFFRSIGLNLQTVNIIGGWEERNRGLEVNERVKTSGQETNEMNFTSPLSLRRDLFIIPGIEVSFSALTQNLAFFPRKLMVRLFTQNGNYK
jgi:hypothetical protein